MAPAAALRRNLRRFMGASMLMQNYHKAVSGCWFLVPGFHPAHWTNVDRHRAATGRKRHPNIAVPPSQRQNNKRKTMPRIHRYQTTTTWTGNLGTGTSEYKAYSRNHEITAAKKSAAIQGSSDPLFRGDPSRYNPEDLLVGALSACHMLW